MTKDENIIRAERLVNEKFSDETFKTTRYIQGTMFPTAWAIFDDYWKKCFVVDLLTEEVTEIPYEV